MIRRFVTQRIGLPLEKDKCMTQAIKVLSRRWLTWSVVAIVLVVGGYFRLAGLSDTSMHSDGQIHDVCKMSVTPVDILVKWEQLLGRTSQMAVPAALAKLFLDFFHLPPTRDNVILPFAIWGMLAILAALWVGRRLGGQWFGLLLMAVVAFNPMHVQQSRMAYFYPPSVVGSFLMIWCLIESWSSMKAGTRLGWKFHVVHVCAIALLIYSTASAWLFVGALGLVHIGCSLFKRAKRQVSIGEMWILVASYVVVGVPLLFVSWGVEALMATTGQNDSTAYWRKIYELDRAKSIWMIVSQEFSKFGWGWTPVRAIVTGAVFLSGSLAMIFRMRRDMRWGLPLLGLVTGLAISTVALQTSVLSFSLRRVAPIWPFGFVVLAAGLAMPWLIEIPKRWGMAVRVVWGGLVAILFGLWLNADVLAVKANGFPVPYRQIAQWLDNHFPKGTPVVTDRFYTAMCEFNIGDPATNVVVISTVPNEIPEIQEKTKFRAVTRRYFEENPDAVFYCNRHMYERPEVEPWDWPLKYFKRSQEMRDDQANALIRIGQNYHMGYTPNLQWPVVYYNEVADVVTIKRAEGALGFVLWGGDWRPVQTQDYRLWRLLLSDNAGLQVYSLGGGPQDITLELSAVAVGGELKVKFGDQAIVFPANQIVQQRLQVKVQPGMNVLQVRSRGAQNVKLLIGRLEVVTPGSGK
jgi:hypothetical protein